MKYLISLFIISFLIGCGSSSTTTNQSAVSEIVEESNETFLQLNLSNIENRNESFFLFDFFENNNFEGEPSFSFVSMLNLSRVNGNYNHIVSLVSLNTGNYYLRVTLDENQNSQLDDDERNKVLKENNEAKLISIGDFSRQSFLINFSLSS